MKLKELLENFDPVTIKYTRDKIRRPSFRGSLNSVLPVVYITLGDIQFRVVLDGTNIWWGMVPGTNSKAKINNTRDEQGRSNIMKVLVPQLKEAIRLLLDKEEQGNWPKVFHLLGKTKKAQQLYRSWTDLHPDYETKVWPQGITLIHRDRT